MSGSTLRGSGPPKRYYLRLLLGITLLLTAATHAAKPTDPPRDGDSVDLGGGYVEHMGFVSASDAGVDFTDETLRHLAVSIGQLGGVNPETGAIITNDWNLLSLVAWELDITGYARFYTNVTFEGIISGNGEGITNILAASVQGYVTDRQEIHQALDTKAAEIWNVVYANTNRITGLELASTDTNNPHQVSAEQLDALPCSGGSMTGDIDMSGAARITNLPEPSNDQDAVSKSYLDKRLNCIEPQGDIGMGIYTNRPGL